MNVFGRYSLNKQAKLLRPICACVLSGILVAGLWPFHAPRNDVNWLNEGDGIFFGKHGSLVSASPFLADQPQAGDSCSIEIWLKPNRIDADGVGMILAFYSPAGKLMTFSVRQYRGGLVMERESPHSVPRENEIYVGEVFGGERPVLITITSSGSGTATYVDGVLKRAVPWFSFSGRDLTGKMVVGNAPSTSYYWLGQLKGLAIYDHELSPAEVLQSASDWGAGSLPSVAKNAGIVARYVFDERKGRVVHNAVDAATNLLIPEHFFVLNEQFLERPWDEFRPAWSYLKDVLVNIVGFVPLGFFFYAYFSTFYRVGKVRRATWITVGFGFAVSLTIEVLQSFLPTRDSGMTDLITNTSGTALGVILWRWCMKRNRFGLARISSVPESEKPQEDVCLIS